MRRLFAIVTLLLVAAACGRAPSSPSSPPASPPPAPAAIADFSGYWTGTVNYKGCGGNHCFTVDRTDPFSLRLRQAGNRVVGLFTINSANIEVSGEVGPDGSLALAGAEGTGGTGGVVGDATFAASDLRLDPATGLKGTLRYESRMFNYVQGWFRADGPIVSATRQNLDAYIADLSGTWAGRYLVRECIDETGRPLCGGLFVRTGFVEYLELKIAVNGTAASGELIPVSTRIPVGGGARGRTIELTGTVTDSTGRYTDRITGLTASVDEYGRLKGDFSYVRVANGVTSTAKVDLVQVVKKPWCPSPRGCSINSSALTTVIPGMDRRSRRS